MREQVWNRRKANFEHYRWLRDLTDLHLLTLDWLEALDLDHNSSSYSLDRILAPKLKSKIESLVQSAQHTIPQEFEAYLDDAYPEEVLERLEQTVWIVQAWTLRTILDQVPDSEKAALLNILERSSWNAGRELLKKRWPHLANSCEEDIRILLPAFRDTPFSGYPRSNHFLVQRAVTHEIQNHLLGCPHLKPYLEVQSVASELCRLHHQWMHGFAYEMNSNIASEYFERSADTDLPVGNYCKQRWFFHHESRKNDF